MNLHQSSIVGNSSQPANQRRPRRRQRRRKIDATIIVTPSECGYAVATKIFFPDGYVSDFSLLNFDKCADAIVPGFAVTTPSGNRLKRDSQVLASTSKTQARWLRYER